MITKICTGNYEIEIQEFTPASAHNFLMCIRKCGSSERLDLFFGKDGKVRVDRWRFPKEDLIVR